MAQQQKTAPDDPHKNKLDCKGLSSFQMAISRDSSLGWEAEQKVFLLFGQRQPISADHPRGFGEMGLHFQSKLLSNASECLKGLDAGSECRKSATMTPIRLASVF
jgi:hypothetical protein